MEKYKNLGGNSGIINYEIGTDIIFIQFKDMSVYSYSYNKAGQIHVEQMKYLAKAGKGLNSYLMKNVHDKYD